jgi:hypothetical protein
MLVQWRGQRGRQMQMKLILMVAMGCLLILNGNAGAAQRGDYCSGRYATCITNCDALPRGKQPGDPAATKFLACLSTCDANRSRCLFGGGSVGAHGPIGDGGKHLPLPRPPRYGGNKSPPGSGGKHNPPIHRPPAGVTKRN